MGERQTQDKATAVSFHLSSLPPETCNSAKKEKNKKRISREGNVGSPSPQSLLGLESGVLHVFFFFFLCEQPWLLLRKTVPQNVTCEVKGLAEVGAGLCNCMRVMRTSLIICSNNHSGAFTSTDSLF